MLAQEIESDVAALENERTLFDEANFGRRFQALDFLELDILDRIDGILARLDHPPELVDLKERAQRLTSHLEELNRSYFAMLRQEIRACAGAGIPPKGLLESHVGNIRRDAVPHDKAGYDVLDAFVAGLLLYNPFPVETNKPEPEMIAYQPTPARIIFELIETAQFTTSDVFYDLGSGLGQVPILVNLFSGAKAVGVEFEPAYFEYASACAADLNLPRVSFDNLDARKAAYSDGTAFFMYTPFVGGMLDAVLELLRSETRGRSIRLFTYGPCTPQVCRQVWLRQTSRNGLDPYALAGFTSAA